MQFIDDDDDAELKLLIQKFKSASYNMGLSRENCLL